MNLSILLIFVVLFLEGIIHNYIVFYPFLFGMTLLLTYPKFKKKSLYWGVVVISTIIYDLLYTDILFWNTFFYFLILSKLLPNKKDVGLLELGWFYLSYHFLSFSCLYILKVNVDILFYLESLILSIPFNLLFFLLIRLILRREKRKRSLNY